MRYAKIENGAIAKFREVDPEDTILIAKLVAHDYRPVDDIPEPEFDQQTQHIVTTYEIGAEVVTQVHTVTDYPDIFMADKWCQVVEGEILSGPIQLPRVWNGVKMWLLTEAEVNAMDWLRYIDTPPVYDEDLQYLTSEKVIGEDDVTETYTVNDYTAEEMATRLLAAQTARKTAIRKECETRILSAYPMWMQVNGANGLDPSAEVDVMLSDIADMRTESNTCEDAVDTAETLQAVRDVTPTWPIEAEV